MEKMLSKKIVADCLNCLLPTFAEGLHAFVEPNLKKAKVCERLPEIEKVMGEETDAHETIECTRTLLLLIDKNWDNPENCVEGKYRKIAQSWVWEATQWLTQYSQANVHWECETEYFTRFVDTTSTLLKGIGAPKSTYYQCFTKSLPEILNNYSLDAAESPPAVVSLEGAEDDDEFVVTNNGGVVLGFDRNNMIPIPNFGPNNTMSVPIFDERPTFLGDGTEPLDEVTTEFLGNLRPWALSGELNGSFSEAYFTTPDCYIVEVNKWPVVMALRKVSLPSQKIRWLYANRMDEGAKEFVESFTGTFRGAENVRSRLMTAAVKEAKSLKEKGKLIFNFDKFVREYNR